MHSLYSFNKLVQLADHCTTIHRPQPLKLATTSSPQRLRFITAYNH